MLKKKKRETADMTSHQTAKVAVCLRVALEFLGWMLSPSQAYAKLWFYLKWGMPFITADASDSEAAVLCLASSFPLSYAGPAR